MVRELTPELDSVVFLEREFHAVALQLECAEERVDAAKDQLASAKAAGEAEAERNRAKTVALLNDRARATEELEQARASRWPVAVLACACMLTSVSIRPLPSLHPHALRVCMRTFMCLPAHLLVALRAARRSWSS